MDIQHINQYTASFDAIMQTIKSDDDKEEVEVWFARDLQAVLGYARWENFQTAIARAVESCKSQNINVDDHFREVTKMIALAKGAQREINDYMLTRFACYLIAQNGNPKKEEIAFAQNDFAVQSTSTIMLPSAICSSVGVSSQRTSFRERTSRRSSADLLLRKRR